MEAVCTRALDHRHKLEMKEARHLIEYVSRYDPAFKRPGFTLDTLLGEIRPDRRESVLIVLGSGMVPQLHDRFPAERLREEINRRGSPHAFRWAAIVTDSSLLDEPVYMECPVIAIGGPAVNKVTKALQNLLPTDSTKKSLRIQHDIQSGDRRMALWGAGPKQTAEAVECAVSSGLLHEFLNTIWVTN